MVVRCKHYQNVCRYVWGESPSIVGLVKILAVGPLNPQVFQNKTRSVNFTRTNSLWLIPWRKSQYPRYRLRLVFLRHCAGSDTWTYLNKLKLTARHRQRSFSCVIPLLRRVSTETVIGYARHVYYFEMRRERVAYSVGVTRWEWSMSVPPYLGFGLWEKLKKIYLAIVLLFIFWTLVFSSTFGPNVRSVKAKWQAGIAYLDVSRKLFCHMQNHPSWDEPSS